MKKLFLTLAIILCLAARAQAATYYVDNTSTSCSTPSDTDYDPTTDTCGGGSNTVYNTLNGALGVAVSGDTILVASGTYAETITNPPAGITIRGESSTPANWPVFQPASGTDFVSYTTTRSSETVFQYIRIDMSQVSNAHGCMSQNNSFNAVVTFKDFECKGRLATTSTSAAGFHIGNSSVGVQFIRGEIWNWTDDGSPGAHCFYWRGNNGLIEHVNCHDVNGYGIQYYNANATTISGNTFRYNYFHGFSLRGPMYFQALSSGTTVNNNVFTDWSGPTAVQLRGSSQKFYNNTLYETSNVVGVGLTGSAGGCSSGCEVTNNLINIASGTPISGSDGATLTTNITTGTATDLMIDPVNNNFSPKESSAAIDAGTAITGFSYVGSKPDVGASEACVRAGALVDSPATDYKITFDCPSQSVAGNGQAGVGLQANAARFDSFALRDDTGGTPVNMTENSLTVSGTNLVTIGTTAGFGSGTAVGDTFTRDTLANGTLRDNLAIGDPNGTEGTDFFNAIVRTYSEQAGTNNIGGGSATWTLLHYRCLSWYSSTTPAATDWRRAEDASYTTNSDLACTSRPGGYAAMAVAYDVDTDVSPIGINWFQNYDGGSYAAMTNTASATALGFAAQNAPSMSSGEDVGCILTDPHSNCITGKVVAQQESQPTVDMSANSTFNAIILVHIHPDAIVGKLFCLKAALAGTDETSISQSTPPCFKVVNPSAGF